MPRTTRYDNSFKRKAVLRETKSTPSSKQKFSFVDNGNALEIVREDHLDGKSKRLSSIREIVSTFLMSVFLPVGFPDSVSADYVPYQAWNCLQDFCNSILRTLATHAILKGAGVGDAEATPLAATIAWLLKDATGTIGSIGFAYLKGTSFENDSKKWRLFADVINDLATFLDLLSAYVSLGFTFTQCLSSFVKSIVGVAGGATRASLVQHQAKANNMADIQAKDHSQETCTNLVAFVCGLTLVPFVAGNASLVWTIFTIFTCIHLFANYNGIRSLRIPLLNLSRLGVCVRHFILDQSLDIEIINDSERVWFFAPCPVSKYITSGVSVATHVKDAIQLQKLEEIFANEGYLLTVDEDNRKVCISYEESSDHETVIRGCFQALLISLSLFSSSTNDVNYFGQRITTLSHLRGDILLRQSLKLTHDLFPDFQKKMESRGWDLSRCLIPRGDFTYSFDKTN